MVNPNAAKTLLELGETPPPPPPQDMRVYAGRMLAALDKAHMVRVEYTGRQITAVTLRRTAGGAWLWGQIAPRLLRASRPTLAVEEMAVATGRRPRTVWRWLSGDTVPSPADVAKVFKLLAGRAPPKVIRELRVKYGQDAPVTKMWYEDLAEVIFRHTFFLLNADLSAPEVARAHGWLLAELTPYIKVLEALRLHDDAP